MSTNSSTKFGPYSTPPSNSTRTSSIFDLLNFYDFYSKYWKQFKIDNFIPPSPRLPTPQGRLTYLTNSISILAAQNITFPNICAGANSNHNWTDGKHQLEKGCFFFRDCLTKLVSPISCLTLCSNDVVDPRLGRFPAKGGNPVIGLWFEFSQNLRKSFKKGQAIM